MEQNVGKVDRIARIVIGLLLLSLVVIGPKSAWGFIGVIPLFTGLFSRCGLYSLLGMNTCRKGA